jgi:aspartate-semialdehyde dehydrogenase
MSPKKRARIALIGVESFRGKELKHVLKGKKFPIEKIEFFDPEVEEEYSKLTEFRGEPRVVMPLDEAAIADYDFVFLASDKKTNREFGNLAVKKKYLAIDLSETFCADKKVPIVVGGINHIAVLKKKPALIANPHSVTIILAHVLNVICEKYHPKKIAAFVLQPASAFEEAGIKELADQSFAVLNSSSVSKKTFKTQIAFNLLSDVAPVDNDGFSSVEKRILSETKRVLNLQDLPLSVAIIQAPVFHTYSIMIHLELEERTDIPTLVDRFKKSPYFKVASPSPSHPVSCLQVTGKDKIYIGQIKKEDSVPDKYWIWTVADNLTRGSALNAYEILESSYPGLFTTI